MSTNSFIWNVHRQYDVLCWWTVGGKTRMTMTKVMRNTEEEAEKAAVSGMVWANHPTFHAMAMGYTEYKRK